MATNHSALIKAAEQFLATAKEYKSDHLTQMDMLKQLDKMRLTLEGPMDPILRQWDTIHTTAAMNLLVSTGALQQIPTEGTITSQELADAVGIDESVITRAMRVICVQGIAEEPETDVYAHNAKSLAYITGTSQYFFQMVLHQDLVMRKLPDYFKTHTKEDLFDLRKSPYAHALDREGMTYYQVISDDPDRLHMFNQTLTQMDQQMPILGMFPFAALKNQVEASPQKPFIVDVGGGRGQVLMSVQKEAPAGFGAKMILQDRPDVLAAIAQEDIPNIEKMEHDFFTPQPVKGAHIYLLRRILHDFYEPVCIEIVKNIASAMDSDSRLVIGDFVVPDKTHLGDDSMVYWMDFLMMMLTGKEKTRKEFERILDAAGLQIVKVWPFAVGAQAIVEARLKRA
ncbi:o-methyltransferas-like protein [Mytilinidion resinicola]|uniref:O-methyltransferas-like protein n=1 Tax=Mytilinidion resinicola TaxID=574789 RepID=A0A6A6YPY8_9PEZI|nr:o-methyltransferas-like protein [Mytilinidion resinicola]KAF2809937.1 o-methyltransferas-like protein [Mytilinidion resinicola]